MGDWLRRLLYPLVLPTIVSVVWLCGWVRQQDDRIGRHQWSLPPLEQARRATEITRARFAPPPAPPQPAPGAHDFFATASTEDAADPQ
jgi:hypothetical protein